MTKKKTTDQSGSADKGVRFGEGAVDMDFGGLFKGLGNMIDLVGKLAEAGEKQKSGQGEFKVKGLGDQAKGVYGFSIRSGLGGQSAKVEPFGNVYSSDDGVEVNDVREPLVDVFDEGDEFVITAELPGVKKADITTTFKGDQLTIKTSGGRQYVKEIELPSKVKSKTLKQSYNNGVLELRVNKAK
ncbi:Hsp20/alpha crystallin family protein [Flexibacterium corallicola]|uniref:Hsp20/alpha crystallin family protein n=1 Tax=Flexibacterium corallicola TaxID=3037259 RepID=UPI00286EEE2C|nr:Hsp20/alpha crystallin family protein [Pseudovibrio sp. M1P-2-3]